jgi:hypothetical protein
VVVVPLLSVLLDARVDLDAVDVLLMIDLAPDVGQDLVDFVHFLLVDCADCVLNGSTVDLDVLDGPFGCVQSLTLHQIVSLDGFEVLLEGYFSLEIELALLLLPLHSLCLVLLFLFLSC